MNEFHLESLQTLAIELPDEVRNNRMRGEFGKAREAIVRWLERPVGDDMKTRLRLELLFLEQLPSQFPYTAAQAIDEFSKLVPDFQMSDLERLDKEGLAEWIYLDGEKHYIHNVVRNVSQKDREIAHRAGLDTAENTEKQLLNDTIAYIRSHGSDTWEFSMQETIRLRDDLFHPGMKLKAHLPIPAKLYQTKETEVTSCSDGVSSIDAEDAWYRAVCFEDTPKENREFSVTYTYTVTASYHDFSQEDYEAALAKEQELPEHLEQYTGEQYPHIRFSPYLRSLAAQIVGDETDPLSKARRIYDYITQNVKYSYMRDYFLIEDIPQYCARNLRGDCGVQALLFITLCRICGIPAGWQSGLYTIPGSVGPHDWAMFYVRPYGWLFADPSFGGSAFRDGDEERRKFYFGNLDPFRMTANHAFQHGFDNPKQFLPIDPYDNQTGELESDTRGFGKDEVVHTNTLLSANRRAS